MSEEEIIENIQDEIELLSIDDNKTMELSPILQKELAEKLQGLLDLYKKNKIILRQGQYDKIFYFSNKDYISKDKIREKIKERIKLIDDWLENGKYANYGMNPYILQGQKEELEKLLQELLEGDNNENR